MKTLIKICLLVIVSINLLSCMIQEPISVVAPQNNKTYEIEYLFEHDGCKMYRFRDGDYYVYFTNCKGEVSTVVNDSTQIRVIQKLKNQLPK